MFWTLSKIIRNLGYLAFAVVFMLSVFNSINMVSTTASDELSSIQFKKRLDEMKGVYKVGRMAASYNENHIDVSAEEPRNGKSSLLMIKTFESQTQREVIEETVTQKIPAPVIEEDLSLRLDQVFLKEPLAEGSFSGYAEIVDGEITEVVVNLPGGETIEIFSQGRLVGNVFEFDDTQTGELRSGMFYEVKSGSQYMITLTNDSQYPGLRLGFSLNGEGSSRHDSYDNRGDYDNYAEQEYVDPYEERLREDAEYEESLSSDQESSPTASFNF